MNHPRLIALLASLALGALGCKQGLGDRCEINSDCASGTCSQAVPKVCVSKEGDEAQIDATLPCDAPCDGLKPPPDAASDAARD